MWPGNRAGRVTLAGIGIACSLAIAFDTALAQTLEQTLTAAYGNNPTLNAQRAATRAIDENVPKALSGYRPTVTGAANATKEALGTTTAPTTILGIPVPGTQSNKVLNQSALSVTVTQSLYNGFRTGNTTRSAEAQVFQSRETLRATEQQVLLDATTAHMNVIRDEALVQLQQQNVQALAAQLKAAKDRFDVGEVTRTDVALAEAAEAGGRAALIQAQSTVNTSRAVYRQVVGSKPGKLLLPNPLEPLLPRSLDAALNEGVQRNPSVVAAQYAIDYASLQVKVAEGALLPSVNAQGVLSRANEPQIGVTQQTIASVGVAATAPVYQGGAEYAAVRQAKETLGQSRDQMEVTRDQVRSAIVQQWSLLEAAKATVQAAQSQVNSQKIALQGITEEYKVGQRTITDVLTAQANLVQAQSTLVNAMRDRIVNYYGVLGAIGVLDVATLGLQIVTYDPQIHYEQVRDTWGGLRTPSGQ